MKGMKRVEERSKRKMYLLLLSVNDEGKPSEEGIMLLIVFGRIE